MVARTTMILVYGIHYANSCPKCLEMGVTDNTWAKGTRTCRDCGADNEFKYCPRCGYYEIGKGDFCNEFKWVTCNSCRWYSVGTQFQILALLAMAKKLYQHQKLAQSVVEMVW